MHLGVEDTQHLNGSDVDVDDLERVGTRVQQTPSHILPQKYRQSLVLLGDSEGGLWQGSARGIHLRYSDERGCYPIESEAPQRVTYDMEFNAALLSKLTRIRGRKIMETVESRAFLSPSPPLSKHLYITP